MKKLENILWISVFIVGLLIILQIYKSGIIRKELIFERTGKEVSWFTAACYPEQYFIEATIIENKAD